MTGVERRAAAAPMLVRIGVYALLAVAITFPLAMNPGTMVAGAMRSDAFNALWNLWFVHDGLARGTLPIFTTLLDFPHGGQIVVADPLNTLLAFPLVSMFGIATAYAILVLGHLTFAGAAADALGRRLGGSGWVAGIGYQCAPIVLSHIHNGSSESISAGWLPLAVLAAFDLAKHGGARRTVQTGVALFLCAVGGWYAGIGAFLAVGALIVTERAWRVLPGIVLALMLVLPVASAIKSVSVAEDGLVDIKNPDDLSRIRRTIGAADPRVFVLPGEFRSPNFRTLEGNPNDYVHTAYLGFVLLVLAVWKGRHPALWLAFVAGILLAMGPVIVFNGFPLAIHGKALPLPYALLESLPGFSSLSLLYRIATVAALSIAVLADRAAPRWAIAVLAETFLISSARDLPTISPIPDHRAITELGAMPDGAVINLPVSSGRTFLFEQTYHHKPIAGSLNAGINKAGLKVLFAARELRLDKIDKPTFVGICHEVGIRYVLLHKNALMSEAFITSATGIQRNFSSITEDDKVTVYALW